MVKPSITLTDLKKVTALEITFNQKEGVEFLVYKEGTNNWTQINKLQKSKPFDRVLDTKKVQRMFNSTMDSHDTGKKNYEVNLWYKTPYKNVLYKSFKGENGKRFVYTEA